MFLDASIDLFTVSLPLLLFDHVLESLYRKGRERMKQDDRSSWCRQRSEHNIVPLDWFRLRRRTYLHMLSFLSSIVLRVASSFLAFLSHRIFFFPRHRHLLTNLLLSLLILSK
jgi:hypothetical protein